MTNFRDRRKQEMEAEREEESAKIIPVPLVRFWPFVVIVLGGDAAGEPLFFSSAESREAAVKAAMAGGDVPPDRHGNANQVDAIPVHEATREQLEKAMMGFQVLQLLGAALNAQRLVQPAGAMPPGGH